MKAENYTLPNVKLAEFEGPLDLLLHLVRKSQMSIYDIKISEITAQYLQYLHSQESLVLNIAGEYLVMAAKLTEIKGKLLLPHDEEVIEEEDPRNDLVDQLLVYQMFKEASEGLKSLEKERQTSFTRPEMEIPPNEANRLAPGVKISDLQFALQKVLARQALLEPTYRTVKAEEVTLEERMSEIKKRIFDLKQCCFEDLFIGHFSRETLVTTFMAILELAKNHQILLEQPARKQSILIKLGEV
ncbi:segregation/condensation protein A [Pediococcus sp. EKM202D]|uniref:segregation and condensation protein A n=1 Tax=unclassified Pediococcus TaxID=554805 RepID=UPI00142E4BED|nr:MULTISPECIES: segregation/condensation protein A [unclassified Pediococcus]KAF5441086.1 segregation/condensation protein A [Pediococcus sp. EKM202D]KAF5441351.1 segregation/condensation protein A [Pediococcus sp. EKM201D]